MKFIAVLPGAGGLNDIVIKTDDYSFDEIRKGYHIENIRNDLFLPFEGNIIKLYDENMCYLQDISVDI